MNQVLKQATDEFEALYGTRFNYLLDTAKDWAGHAATNWHELTVEEVLEKSLIGARLVARILHDGVRGYVVPTDVQTRSLWLVNDTLPVHFWAKNGVWSAEYSQGIDEDGLSFFIPFQISDDDTTPLDACYFGAAA